MKRKFSNKVFPNTGRRRIDVLTKIAAAAENAPQRVQALGEALAAQGKYRDGIET